MLRLVVIFQLVFLSFFCFAKTSRREINACCISQNKQMQLLSLSFYEFDQTPGEGWRPYVDETNCYESAGQLIEAYLDINNTSLKSWQKHTLNWHSGRMYALAGENTQAKLRWKESLKDADQEDVFILWKSYIIASIAFLDRDFPTLLRERNKIAQGPVFNGIKTHLTEVDRLIQFFEHSYLAAQSAAAPYKVPQACAKP